MRYVSSRKPDSLTPAQRIEAIRRNIEPPKGRKSRQSFISKEDFAALLGAGRSTVINWTTGKRFPEERYRNELARLSGGRYRPEDFENPRGDEFAARRAERRLEPRIARLEDAVARIERALELSDPGDARER